MSDQISILMHDTLSRGRAHAQRCFPYSVMVRPTITLRERLASNSLFGPELVLWSPAPHAVSSDSPPPGRECSKGRYALAAARGVRRLTGPTPRRVALR